MPPIAITFHSRVPPRPFSRLPTKNSSSSTRHARPTATGGSTDPLVYFTFDNDPGHLVSARAAVATVQGVARHPLGNNNNNRPSHYPTHPSSPPPASSSSKTSPSPVPTPVEPITPHGVTTTTTTTTTTTARATRSKRGKPTFVHPPPSAKVYTLTPLLQPIIDRCFVTSPTDSDPTSTHVSTSPLPAKRPGSATMKKRHSGQSNGSSTPTTLFHPYSRATDTRNDRSNVPSPREILRAERLEVEKARAKEESAAAARAAAALKRRKGAKSRATSKGNHSATSTSRLATHSISPNHKDRQLEEDKEAEQPITTTTTTSTSDSSKESSAPAPSTNPLPPRVGLKRTRSAGLGISTLNSTAFANAGPAVSSPLRAVTVAGNDEEENEEDGHARKRSKLSEAFTAEPETIRTRRATTGSPTDRSALHLAHEHAIDDSAYEPKTDPIPQSSTLPGRRASVSPRNAKVSSLADEAETGAPPSRRRSSTGMGLKEEQAEMMRRAASAGEDGEGEGLYSKPLNRTMSGSGSENGRDRVRREVTVPARLRDYEMKAAV
ncbi:hypothetical protein DB88DRAFT_474596 [Papiliotrema laurentii]|uniref:Uncharacterized protein n=1 Tax=Papiliotrema laurentii TaxID=5418 RepID=A0AAD9FMP7_PAPLA|nr:hypothetical protein DB88DRAFT_474596 [Papiliotrema laurentii]